MKPYFPNSQGFMAWLADSESGPQELLHWLHIGFGSHRDSADPHQEIISALEDSEDLALREKLTRWVAVLLKDQPDLNFKLPKTTNRELVASELLFLAAALDSPEDLADPIWQVYQTLLLSEKRPDDLVSAALREAMIHNQKHDLERRKVWLDMVAGKVNPVLGGTRSIGDEGCAMMPGSNPAEPDMDGLLELARIYALNQGTRLFRMRRQFRYVKDLWSCSLKYYLEKIDANTAWNAPALSWLPLALIGIDGSLSFEGYFPFGEMPKNSSATAERHFSALIWRPWFEIIKELNFISAKEVQNYFAGSIVLATFSGAYDTESRIEALERALKQVTRGRQAVGELELVKVFVQLVYNLRPALNETEMHSSGSADDVQVIHELKGRLPVAA